MMGIQHDIRRLLKRLRLKRASGTYTKEESIMTRDFHDIEVRCLAIALS
jgi:hypothetical protein